MIDKLAGLMNLNCEVFYSEPEAPINWKDRVRWFNEGIISALFNRFFEGSADELQMAEDGDIAPKYWNERQKAHIPEVGIYDAYCFSRADCWRGAYQECLPNHVCPRCGKDSVTLQ
jgi:hypothetical protein